MTGLQNRLDLAQGRPDYRPLLHKELTPLPSQLCWVGKRVAGGMILLCHFPIILPRKSPTSSHGTYLGASQESSNPHWWPIGPSLDAASTPPNCIESPWEGGP